MYSSKSAPWYAACGRDELLGRYPEALEYHKRRLHVSAGPSAWFDLSPCAAGCHGVLLKQRV